MEASQEEVNMPTTLEEEGNHTEPPVEHEERQVEMNEGNRNSSYSPLPTSDALAASAGTKRKRVCVCPLCGVQGHYQKSCPQIGHTPIADTCDGTESSGPDPAEEVERRENKLSSYSIYAMAADNGEAPLRPPPREHSKSKKAIWVQQFETRNCGKHTPLKLPDVKKRKCVVCSIRCRFKCEECDIYVHLPCWRKFHDIENPWQQAGTQKAFLEHKKEVEETEVYEEEEE